MEAIDILLRRDGEEDALGVHVAGQGKLDEDAINVITGIELFDQSDELVSGRRLRRSDQLAEDAHLLAGADLAADIRLGCGIVPDKDRGQTGTQSGDGNEKLHLVGDFGLDLVRVEISVEYDRGHKSPCGEEINYTLVYRDWRGDASASGRRRKMIPAKMVQTVVCPICHGGLRFNEDFTKLRCTECGKHYRVQDEVPVLLAQEAE
jgi:uncharacterized protein YbaR (Trm112 family)